MVYNMQKVDIMKYVNSGKCAEPQAQGCVSLNDDFQSDVDHSNTDIQIFVLSSILRRIKARPLRRLLQLHDITFEKTSLCVNYEKLR